MVYARCTLSSHCRFDKVVENYAMGKTKEVPQRIRKLIDDEHNRGIGYHKISIKYNIHVSTIKVIIQRWKRYGVVTNPARKGRPREIYESAERLITRKVMQKPYTTREETRRDLSAADADVSQDTIGQAFHRVGMQLGFSFFAEVPSPEDQARQCPSKICS